MSGLVRWKKAWRRVASFSEKIGKPAEVEGSTLGDEVGWDGLDWLRNWETPVQSSGQEGDQRGEKRVMLELSEAS